MKNNLIPKLLFYLLIFCFFLLLDSVKNSEYSVVTNNNIKILSINIVLSFLLFLLYSLWHKGFTKSRKGIYLCLWALLVLCIYFLLGNLLADIFLKKHPSIWINLLSVSILTILGIAYWSLLYFSKGSYKGGGWISIPDLEWVLLLGFFPYSMPLGDYIHRKKMKLLLVLVPVFSSILIWLGMEFEI